MPSFENFPNISFSSKRKNIPDGLWNRCEVCGEITFSKELDRNFKICPKCGYHYPMSASERIRMLIASDSFIEYESSIKIPSAAFDPSPSELVAAGEARLHKYQIVLCIINLNYIDGSNIQFKLNKTEYEKILYTFNKSLVKSLPLITFYADGTIVNLESEYTAPICESASVERSENPRSEAAGSEWLSFIFLINLAATVEKLSQKHIPHITVLTNARIGGEFSTSFPLGDIVLAEPKPVDPKCSDNKKNSIITKNIPQLQLPSENYLIDRYVNRRDLKKNLTKILSFCIG